jgi:hypothetical protein
MDIWQVAVAVMGAIAALVAGCYLVIARPLLAQIKRFDSQMAERAQANDIIRRLERIEAKQDDLSHRITRLEERRYIDTWLAPATFRRAPDKPSLRSRPGSFPLR